MKKTLLACLTLLTSNSINANTLSDFNDESWLDAERFSISVTAGKSRFNYDNQDYDSGFEEEYGNHFKQSSTHIALSLGYEINEYFTASVNYQNLGEYSGTKAFSHEAKKFGSPTTGVSSTVRVAGGGAAITAQYPITDSILPYARLGVLAYEAKQTNSYIMTRKDKNQQTVHRVAVERPIRDYK